MDMSYPFTRPNDTSTGGAGGGARGGSFAGRGRVMNQRPPRTRPYPWPLPYSATQGAVGCANGKGLVSVPNVPWYQPYQPYWPYAVPDQFYRGLPTPSPRM